MFDWNDLRYLLAVKDAGSLSAAARTLGIDKATVSRRVAALERGIGVRLFDRRASGWTPTAAGKRALAAAGEVDALLAALAFEVVGGTGGPRAVVRLTVPLWFCSEVLTPHLAELQRMAPWLDLVITAGSRVVNLAEREAEIGLRNRRPPKGEFVVRKAGELGSALYAAKCRNDSAKPISKRDDLRGERMVGYPDALTYVPGFAWLNEMGAALGPVLRVDDAHGLTAAIRAGLGAGVLPCILGDREPGLVRLLAERAVETIWLVAPIELARTRPIRVVLAFVADVFRRERRRLAG